MTNYLWTRMISMTNGNANFFTKFAELDSQIKYMRLALKICSECFNITSSSDDFCLS